MNYRLGERFIKFEQDFSSEQAFPFTIPLPEEKYIGALVEVGTNDNGCLYAWYEVQYK